jgi:hypothetical protein
VSPLRTQPQRRAKSTDCRQAQAKRLCSLSESRAQQRRKRPRQGGVCGNVATLSELTRAAGVGRRCSRLQARPLIVKMPPHAGVTVVESNARRSQSTKLPAVRVRAVHSSRCAAHTRTAGALSRIGWQSRRMTSGELCPVCAESRRLTLRGYCMAVAGTDANGQTAHADADANAASDGH